MSGTQDYAPYAPFNTGNAQWDQGFNSLARGLFPDPSRAARGAAYGATAREALLKGDQSIAERNAGITAYQQAYGMDATGQPQLPAPPSYRPSGVPGGAPIMNPPPGLNMTQSPVPPPAPSGSLVGLLANIFGSGNSPNAKGVGTTGTPPPASSPAPNSGAPPAPNTTTSDGQPPTNDQGSGAINYNAINTTGGGRQYAPAAAANGSPAPVPIGIGTYMALQAMAGRDAATAKEQGLAFINSAFEHGILPWNTATQMSGLQGNNAPYESDQATGRTIITQQAETGREGMRLGQQESQFGRTVQPNMTTVDAQGNPIVNLPPPKGSTTPVPVGRGFNQPLEEQRREPFTVGGGGPYGSGPQVSTKGDAAGKPGYSAETDRQDQTPVKYVEPGGTVRAMTYGEYKARGAPFPLTQDSMEAVRAAATTAALGGGGMKPSQTVRESTQTSSVPAAVESREGLYQRALVDQDGARRYAPLQDKWAGIYSGRRDLPAQYSAEARSDIISRANDIERDPNSGAAFHNMPEALNRATNELIQGGLLPDDKNVDRGYQAWLAANPSVKKTDKGGVFQIPSLKRYEPGAIAVAPKGANQGDIVGKGDQTGVVRNGFIYPR